MERRFHRQLHRVLIPIAFAAFVFGSFAYRVPEATPLAAVGFLLLVGIAALLHRGLILTADGIRWYTLHPRFVYRHVPWSAVRSARPGWLGGVIRLEVEPGHYEPTLWGTPRSPIVIHTREWVRGEELHEAIEARLRERQSV